MADILDHHEKWDQHWAEHPNESEHQPLTLTTICHRGEHRSGGGRDPRDNYDMYGDPGSPGSDGDSSGRRCRDGGRRHHVDYGDAPASQVTLKDGQTFWELAAEKYNGKYPIEAIYAANNLVPKVCHKEGQIVLEDPTYYAGRTYTLPAAKDIPALIEKYHQQVEDLGGYSEARLGRPDQDTHVKLIYGDTFEKLARCKYGDGERVPVEAIYAANNLHPEVTTDADGKVHLKDPIYYAGKSYVLPREGRVPELVRQFYDQIGHPELCPPEYTEGNGPPPRRGGNPPTERGGEPPCIPDERRDDVREWEDGYRQGYRDGYHDAETEGSTLPPGQRPCPENNQPIPPRPGVDDYYGDYGDLPNRPGDPGYGPTTPQPDADSDGWYGYDGPAPSGGYGGYRGSQRCRPCQIGSSPGVQRYIDLGTQLYTQTPGFRVLGGQFDDGSYNVGLYDPNRITPIRNPGDYVDTSRSGADGTIPYSRRWYINPHSRPQDQG
jgi:hypothetical protein